MCGIFGTVYREKPVDQIDLRRMRQILDRLAYRGPDGHGIWQDEHVLLGHRRLSIIDLSAAGAQPFEDPEHGLYMTYNGEIYNFQEVREDLLKAGYQFKSHTDTEVIMLAYDCYGLDFLKRLHGMFAFCLYDAKQKRLVLARDPLGEKPLFYYLDKDQFVFSSEIKAFHAYSSIPLVIDMQSLEGYFTLQYIPGEHTIYKNIQEIAPGKCLVIDLNNWLCKEVTYWSLFDQFTRQQTTSDDEIDGGLSKSITSRLVGDVKIGVLLSGGIDSSLIAWYIKNHGGNLMAFTAGFERDELDELPYAKQVADNLGMELVQINGGNLTDEIFEDVVFHADEPIGDAACIPTYLLAKELCQYVTVVLSGEGADELFLGYDHYRYEMWYQRFKWLLQWTRNFTGLSQKMQSSSGQAGASRFITRPSKILFSLHDLGASRWTSVFLDASINSAPLFRERITSPIAYYLAEIEQASAVLNKLAGSELAPLLLDLKFWLPNDLLVKVDRMTMAHSVEARAPYLEPDLVSLALNLPKDQKINNRTGKLILRKFMESKFPGEIGHKLAWRKKHGFSTPISNWLTGPLNKLAGNLLSETRLSQQGIFNSKYVQQIWSAMNNNAGQGVDLRRVWLLLCFQSWYEWHERRFGFKPI